MNLDQKISVLEAAMDRLDSIPVEEIDSEFYAETLHELVELRKERDQ